MVATTAHFEHGLPLLAKLDLSKLFLAYNHLQEDPKNLEAVSELVSVIGGAAEARVLRKLSAVQRATFDQLFDAETNPSLLLELERAAAARSFSECLEDAAAFFASLGLSVPAIPVSSGAAAGSPAGAESPGNPDDSL